LVDCLEFPPPPPPPIPYKKGISKTAKIALGLVLVVIIIVASFAVLSGGLLNPILGGDSQGSQNPLFPVIIYEPKLEVYIQEQNGYWTRNSYSDRPELQKGVGLSVTNTGNSEAQEVKVTIKEDWNVINEYSIASLQPSESNSYSFTVYISYDATKTVSVEAYCSQSSDQDSLSITATLPRQFDEALCKLYVTPNEQSIVNLKNQILNDKFLLTPNWMALRDWVGNNIQYSYDSSSHGQNEYWQLPKETLNLRTGDCEDFSILLCSLLRADGWSPNNAYVIVGESNGSYHAWVRIIWSGIEYNIEPQANGWNTLLGDFLSLSGYTAEYRFNDSQFGNT
jgi:predicted transglutaminase-like cysteine proteinase